MKFFLILFLGIFAVNSFAQTIKPYNGPFPVPPPNKNMLFYLHRTIDVNTVIYEVNYNKDGKLNKNKPVKIYWMDFTDGGKITQLTYIQNRFAYGVEFTEIEGQESVYKINLVSYKKIEIYLKPTGKSGAYQAHVAINGKPSILTNILINIVGGTYLKPIVSHIELKGKEIKTEKEITEKIKL